MSKFSEQQKANEAKRSEMDKDRELRRFEIQCDQNKFLMSMRNKCFDYALNLTPVKKAAIATDSQNPGDPIPPTVDDITVTAQKIFDFISKVE